MKTETNLAAGNMNIYSFESASMSILGSEWRQSDVARYGPVRDYNSPELLIFANEVYRCIMV